MNDRQWLCRSKTEYDYNCDYTNNYGYSDVQLWLNMSITVTTNDSDRDHDCMTVIMRPTYDCVDLQLWMILTITVTRNDLCFDLKWSSRLTDCYPFPCQTRNDSDYDCNWLGSVTNVTTTMNMTLTVEILTSNCNGISDQCAAQYNEGFCRPSYKFSRNKELVRVTYSKQFFF